MMDLAMRFDGVITSEEQLLAVLGSPLPHALKKEITALDAHCREFIARSTFLVVSSSDAAGRMDVSPKGDPPGFVLVLDDHTLAIPDRPGNRRADTFRNVLQNPRVGLLFLLPGKGETLRVSGRAAVVRDRALCKYPQRCQYSVSRRPLSRARFRHGPERLPLTGPGSSRHFFPMLRSTPCVACPILISKKQAQLHVK